MKSKKTKGQMATLLNLFFAIFGVFVIGLFAFEMSRYLLARDELKTNVEVAALSCQTALVSSGDPTDATNQTNAQNAGLQLFQQNSILGQTMSQATLAIDPTDISPASGQAQINFQFLDPITRQPVNQSGTGVSTGVVAPYSAGTLIKATAAYSYVPAFGKFIGLGNLLYSIQVSALSGVPKIDLMVLLDISGGMDNDTSLSFYQRYEAPTGTDWMVNPNPITGSDATGPAYTIMCGNTGTPPDIGALMPCQYEKINNSNCVTITHSEDPSVPNSNNLISGPGTPPGNYCSTSSKYNTTGSASYLPKTPHYGPTMPSDLKDDGSIAFLNKPLMKILENHKGHKKQANIVACRKNKPPKYLEIATNQSLSDLCTKISGKKNTKLAGRKTDFSNLDEKISSISFAPHFYVLNAGIPSSSSGTVAVVNTYAGANGYTYIGASREPGQGADTGPTLLPTIDGYCTNPPTGIAGAAPKVFTGAFVTGVLNQTSSDGTMTLGSAAVAIEASLGDLESTAAAQQAGIDVTALGIKPHVGWFAFYYTAARQWLQPYMSFVAALTGFINEMSIVSDVHFGFIAFNDSVGTDASSQSAAINHISTYFNQPTMNPDGTLSVSSTYPLPNIQLSQTVSNQSDVINVLPTLSVWGTRNVTLALQTAYNELQTNGRQGANKAIVLAVSGIPNGSDTSANATQQAATIGQAGIPIYIVCCSIQTGDDSDNDDAYGSNSGIVAASGHGSKYYRLDFSDSVQGQMVSVFGNIARRLVSIVQN